MIDEITEQKSIEAQLFSSVGSFLNNYKNLSQEYRSELVHKICKKLQIYEHHEKNSDFLTMYLQYYVAGYLDRRDFDSIISDGSFHYLEYKPSKDFFIEVYFGNLHLIRMFEVEMLIYPFSNQESKTKYLHWLEENFKICYLKYHK
jgi:hypothetical protein